MNSLTEVKEFDKLKIVKNIHTDSPSIPMQTKTPAKQTCRYCGSSHPLSTMPGMWEEIHRMQQNWPLQSSV